MQLELIIRNADLATILRNYADRRLRFAVSRFGDHVGRVLVTISESVDVDQNILRSCHISVDLKPFGQVIALESDPDLYEAIDRATGRVGRLVALHLGRRAGMAREDPKAGASGTKHGRRRTPARKRIPALRRRLTTGPWRNRRRRPPPRIAVPRRPLRKEKRCRSN